MLFKRIARAILVIAMAGGGAVAIESSPALADNGPLTSSHQAIIVGAGSDRCLDLQFGDSAGNGAPLQLWDCNGSYNQSFSSQAFYTINTRKWNDKCLDVVAGNPGDGARLQQWDCNYNAQQNFSFVYVKTLNGYAYYQIKTTFGKCLDATAQGTGNGTRIQQWTCFKTFPLNQLWSVR
jgi:hypothetical protein